MRKDIAATATLPAPGIARVPRSIGALPRHPRTMLAYDATLAWSTLLLLAIGLVMVYSASIAMAEASAHTGYRPWYFLARHSFFLGIGHTPNVAFLNIGIPGPVFIRKESYIGGQLVPRSVRLEIGKTYEFRVVLKARRPGDWHVHTMMNVEGGGPIIGPGKWITIEGGKFSDFKNPVTPLTGQTVDLETYQEGNIAFWHVFWAAFGVEAVPTVIVFRDGHPVERLDARRGVGLSCTDLAQILRRAA